MMLLFILKSFPNRIILFQKVLILLFILKIIKIDIDNILKAVRAKLDINSDLSTYEFVEKK